MKYKQQRKKGNKKKRYSFSTQGSFQNNMDTSIHSKTIILASLDYVYDCFYPLFPYENRLHKKDFGFSFYDQSFSTYCFDTINSDIYDWRFKNITKNLRFKNFAFQLVGIGCKSVMREILSIIDFTIQSLKLRKKQSEIVTELSNESITRNYRYIRMERECLLPLDLNDVAYGLSVNAKKVWKPFIEIIVYTVHQIHKRTTQNKYYESLLQNTKRNERRPRLQEIVEEKQNTQSNDESSPNEPIIDFFDEKVSSQDPEELPLSKQSIFFENQTYSQMEMQNQVALNDPRDTVPQIIQDRNFLKKQINVLYSQEIKTSSCLLQSFPSMCETGEGLF